MSAFVPSTAPLSARRTAPTAAAVSARFPTSARPATYSFSATPSLGARLPTVAPRHPRPSNTPTMEVTVVVGDNEPVESAIRRFKKDVAKSGHLFELRRRRYFETNTEKRIRKAAASRRKAKMMNRQASRASKPQQQQQANSGRPPASKRSE